MSTDKTFLHLHVYDHIYLLLVAIICILDPYRYMYHTLL